MQSESARGETWGMILKGESALTVHIAHNHSKDTMWCEHYNWQASHLRAAFEMRLDTSTKLVDAIRDCSGINEVRMKPEAWFWKVSLP